MRGGGLMRSAATIAIVGARLRRDSLAVAVAVGACALLGYLQRYDGANLQLAGAILFGSSSGIVAALLQRSGRAGHLELCEQSAPLFGRELARARALVPCSIATGACAAYWLVAGWYAPVDPAHALLTFAAANLAGIVALRATTETGAARWLWLGGACAIAPLGFILQQTPIAAAIGVCTIAGFAALRQYGEALARCDPLDGLSRRGRSEFF